MGIAMRMHASFFDQILLMLGDATLIGGQMLTIARTFGSMAAGGSYDVCSNGSSHFSMDCSGWFQIVMAVWL